MFPTIHLFKVPRLMLKPKGKSIEALENPVEPFLSVLIPFVTRQTCARTPGSLGSLSEKMQPAFEETEPWTVRKYNLRCQRDASLKPSSATQQLYDLGQKPMGRSALPNWTQGDATVPPAGRERSLYSHLPAALPIRRSPLHTETHSWAGTWALT